MRRRQRARPRSGSVVALAALALAAAACGRVDVAPAAGPNVLLVTIDTLRADHVGAFGAGPGRTPTLDALAARGARFEEAMSVAPLTLPSHATLLTGRLPPGHGVRHNGLFRLAEAQTTLAERLHDAGYATGAVVGAAVLDARYGLAQGFDHYDDRTRDAAADGGFRERRAAEVTDAARAWLADAPRPFFLWVHYYDPHMAYRPPPPWDARFPDAPYAGEIAYVDAELGRLLDALGPGEDARTLVTVTADHGEAFGEHGEVGHAYTLYDEVLHVPWILAGPGVRQGAAVDGVVSLADVAPTLLALAGAPPLPEPDGTSRAGALRAGDAAAQVDAGAAAAPPAAAYAETHATQLDHGWAPLEALRTDAHLYVRAPRPELYDLRRDPGQHRNLLAGEDGDAGTHGDPDAVAAALEARLAALGDGDGDAERLAVDDRTRRGLETLGYLVGDAPAPVSGLDPKDGLPLLRRFFAAEQAYFDDRLDEAAREAEALVEAWPGSARVHDLLVRIRLAQGRPQEALRHAETAVALVPASARHRARRGRARLAAGDLPGALADFDAALARDPALAEAHVGRMWALEAGGELADADRHAEAARAADPADPGLALRIAGTWDALGRYARALEAYRRAERLAPEDPRVHAGLALQLARLGDPEQALAHHRRAGALGEAPPRALRLAVAFAARGELDLARSLLEALLARHPDFAPARAVLAEVESRAKG